MDRVAFLIEDTQEHLGCMLNPESLELRRRAGVVQAQTGRPGSILRTDDALLATGGGTTELQLDLLFDVQLSGSSVQTDDVRDLTGPLWRLAENRSQGSGHGRVPQVRFIWGKHWNLPGVVTAVAERLDLFTPGGAPQRSWLRLRLVRVDGQVVATPPPPPPVAVTAPPPGMGSMPAPPPASEHTVLGAGGGDGRSSERLDVLAQRWFGHASAWRTIAAANGLADPLRLPPAHSLRLPLAGSRA